jgi:hypothetical protein
MDDLKAQVVKNFVADVATELPNTDWIDRWRASP